MKNLWKYTLLLVFNFGCGSSFEAIKTVKDQDFKLSQYSTFGFENTQSIEGQEEVNYSDLHTMLTQEVEKRFIEKGLKHTENPELKISLSGIFDEKIQTRQTDFRTDGIHRYTGQRRFSWKSEEVEVGRYKKGTVLLDLIDAKKDLIVWRGGVKGILPSKENKQKEALNIEIEKLVNSIN